MLDPAKDGTYYGVEVKYSDDSRAEWHIRYGWFPEVGEYDRESGLVRAQTNRDFALSDPDQSEITKARIVKKIVTVEVVE